MAHRNDGTKTDLSDDDIKQLADFFYLLWQCDERNKREGRYDTQEAENAKRDFSNECESKNA